MTTPAGWYPSADGERYWDGQQWTDQRRALAPLPAAPVTKSSAPWYRRTWVVAVIALVVGIGIGSSTAGSPDDTKATSSSGTKTDPADEPVVVVEPDPVEDEPEPAAFELKPGHLKLTVKTRQKDCFGSAGCIVVFQINPGFAYPVATSEFEGRTWDITYEVKGGEDGPQVNTMRLEDGTFSFDEDENLSTPSSSTVLAAVVTAVDEVTY